MKVFSVVGYSGSGKTTTIEYIIRELKKRGYSVGSVKEIHYEDFTMEDEGSNTYRHHQAGAEIVTARGFHETNILYKRKLSINEILQFYQHDYVVLEGVVDGEFPLILTGKSIDDLESRMNDKVFLIAGIIANKIDTYENIEVLSVMKEVSRIVDYVQVNAREYVIERHRQIL